MAAYYNEIDPYAAQWLRNLIKAGHIASGDVDERSIVDVRADDLRGYTQCHFFAGIGGWSLALRLAGWPDDRPIWTGSCPCQPFSSAGAAKAADDERHLWPAWFSLISERCPPVVFGEQVEAAIGWGWLDAVFSDLEGQGYACGAAVLPACSVGAPHIRQRSWFVANAAEPDQRRLGRVARGSTDQGQGASRQADGNTARGSSSMGHANEAGWIWLQKPHERQEAREQTSRRADAKRSGFWNNADWIVCTDGRARPVEPGTFPLADGVPNRVGRLRAYGNAIVPQVAAEFIMSTCTVSSHHRQTQQGE